MYVYTLWLHALWVISTFISMLCRIVLPGGGSIESFITKHFPKVVKSPTCLDVWGWGAAACLLLWECVLFTRYSVRISWHYSFLFLFMLVYYLIVCHPPFTHIFSVITFLQSLGTQCGGRGCIGFEHLEASPCCIRLPAYVYFAQIHAPTLWQTHTESQNPSRSFQPN